MAQPQVEICTIRLMFPVDSDEQAIEIKKKITALLVDIPDSQIAFAIHSSPPSPPSRPNAL